MSICAVLSAREADIVLDDEIAYDEDNVYDAVIAKLLVCAQLLVPSNEPVTPLPLKYKPLDDINNEPVITASPENGNPAPAPAFNANEAVFAHDDVPKNEPE